MSGIVTLYGPGCEKPYPKYVRAKDAELYFGVKRDMLNDWVAEGRVIARCEDKAVFYDFDSINASIRNLPAWEPVKRS